MRSLPACRVPASHASLEAERSAGGWSGARPIRAIGSGDTVPPRGLSPLVRGHRLEGTPFVVLRLLGQGGMGEVYEAEHHDLGRRCALKVLHHAHRDRPDLAARMREEARVLAALRHRNLVDVFDLGVTGDGRPYFVMEMLSGRDLGKELARFGVLAVPTALGMVAEALDGLAASHSMGVIHRDIKPENLFVCDDGTLKILDFGIAKATRGGTPLTSHGSVVGTARCMAPEQFTSGAIDPRTDVYAAGLVLYELVTGRGPFDELRGNDHALRFAHCARIPTPPSRVAPQAIPAGVEGAILKAIEKSPEDRFQSAEEMAEALRGLRDDCWRSAARSVSGGSNPAGSLDGQGASLIGGHLRSTQRMDTTTPEGSGKPTRSSARRDRESACSISGGRGAGEDPLTLAVASVSGAAVAVRKVAGAAAAVSTAVARLCLRNVQRGGNPLGEPKGGRSSKLAISRV